eukprot:TRINITY_DN4074_c0_g1_i1.p1 TRINITY_DN4074_c0_g1~~TRINITY_DN4074_c0_g1_i1.p1  ORF type:complete len:248 (-),score=79.39 TRINITY_DN4074_c0_g1_i1:1060-1803(-)
MLARFRIDQFPQIVQKFNIQALPTMFAFSRGKALERFDGLLPPDMIPTLCKALADFLGKSPADQMVSAANDLIAQQKFSDAEKIFQKMLSTAELEAKHVAANAGLVRIAVLNNQLDKAKEILDVLKSKGELKHRAKKEDPAVEQAVALYELVDQHKSLPFVKKPLAELQRAVAADAKNIAARYDFAIAQILQQRFQEAANDLLTCVRQDRKWNNEAARLLLLKLFTALGDDHEVTKSTRKRLANALF